MKTLEELLRTTTLQNGVLASPGFKIAVLSAEAPDRVDVQVYPVGVPGRVQKYAVQGDTLRPVADDARPDPVVHDDVEAEEDLDEYVPLPDLDELDELDELDFND